MKIINTIILALLASVALAQNANTDALTWTATSTTNLKNNETFAFACTFTTRPGNSLDWAQKNGTRVTHYTITQTQGTWPDIAQPGTITFTLSKDNMTGTAVLQRTAGGETTLTLDFSAASTTGIKQKFFISQVTQAN